MLPAQRTLDTPIRARKLGDPDRLVRPQLMVRRPDVVVKLPQRLAVPVEGVKVNVAAARSYGV